ncbi:cap1-related protein [Phaffia rhodozyma]|uniref:Cap1-related protein n=1 Tax=Phaffia rhodozyma TaxID=264483 RepID=A0A0F7SNH0_PHARH|nr:cap1-related protein [Phaffia rhodozyma]
MATLPPWFAYVPANVDFSDLYTILAFFRGSPSSTKGMHDRVAHRIASNGQCWVERTWRIQDMQAYAFRLLLEFERAVSPDRDTGKMDFHYTPRSSGKKVPVPEE